MRMSGNRPDCEALSLSGLENFEPVGVELGVVGWPVRHSISPPMHTAALAALTRADPRFANWRYGAYELRPEELPQGVELFRKKGFRGINLTVPHKVEVLPLLDEIDPLAKRIGAVNTLLFEKDRVKGFNSDGYGLERAVEEAFGHGLAGRDVVILGAGGAARAAAAQCMESVARSILLANRTVSKAQRIVEILNAPPGVLQAIAIQEVSDRMEAGSLVINATSLGLSDEDPAPVEISAFPEHCSFLDMIYNPPNTHFLREGAARGYPVSGGLGMLVHQGVRSLEIWTGYQVDANIMRAACEEVLGFQAS